MNESTIMPFIPLARIVLGDGFDGSSRERWVQPLAQLLEAASRGVGQLPLSDCRVGQDAPSEYFAVIGDNVLLPRNASYWDEVRSRILALYAASAHHIPDILVNQALSRILPPAQQRTTDAKVLFDNADQRLAIAMFADARVGVITGGPGTGKTTTAAALLAVRKRLDPDLAPRDVLLCAPTGKAACRLADSMSAAASRLNLEPLERAFLQELVPLTMHRALEWSPIPPENGGPFRRGIQRPLEQRLVLVDEASMVDLGLMTQLLRALSPHGSLILLGDGDQLKSVETGGVLAELVAHGSQGKLPLERREQLKLRLDCSPDVCMAGSGNSRDAMRSMPGLAIRLRHSYRAMHAPWILELCDITRPGSAGDSAAFFASCERFVPNVRLHDHRRELYALCIERWRDFGEASRGWSLNQPPESRAVVAALRRFQLLCADNSQVERANRLGTKTIWEKCPDAHVAPLPHGCPVIVLQNHAALGLSNGDIGIALGTRAKTAAQAVLFPGNGSPIPIVQLPSHQPAFGLTIHKSQGSEWDSAAVDLPDESRLLDRNLLYTAISRTSGNLDLYVPSRQLLDGVLANPTA